MSNYCFTDVKEGTQYRVAKIIENESGYFPMCKANSDDPHEMDKWIGDKDHIRIVVANMNKHLGVDKDREREIRFSTMTDKIKSFKIYVADTDEDNPTLVGDNIDTALELLSSHGYIVEVKYKDE